MIRSRWVQAAILSIASWGLGVSGAGAETPLFAEQSELELVIDGPIGDLRRSAARSTDPFPAIATIDGRSYEMEISARGLSRRTRGICRFPPIRLDFDKGELDGTLLDGQNRIKLVTRCLSGRTGEQLVALEYTAYRLYNVLTPLSYRVRPVQVTYRDGSREETQFNFLIEDVDDLARRNGLVALDVGANEISASQLEAEAAAMVGLFQFMIGNLDWDMYTGPPGDECCHNGRLLAANEAARQRLIPVPYDFDFSGLVNAPYAAPPESIRVSSVRSRRYRGLCQYNEQARAAAEIFRQRRGELLAVIDSEHRLTSSRQRSTRGYIEEFFDILDDTGRFESQIIERCRG